jgi:predicted nucleic acid-binding protein
MAANLDSNTWVVDCSFTAALFLPDESSKKVATFFNKVPQNKNQLLVPEIWVFETGNVLVSALRRRRISLAQKQEILVLLGQLPIDIISLASLGEVSIIAGISVEDIPFMTPHIFTLLYPINAVWLPWIKSCGRLPRLPESAQLPSNPC